MSWNLKVGVCGVFLLMFPSCSGEADSDSSLGGDPAAVASHKSVEGKQRKVGEGPFGITAGMPLSELSVEGEREAETGLSILKAAPSPNNQFPQVAVISFPETGVCEVRALSATFDSDPYITQASPFADQIAAALETRYGKYKKNAGCGGYSCDSQFKLQHIEDGSLWYGYEWPASDSELPSRVKAIHVNVIHAQFNDSQVRLDYEFDNAEKCALAAKAAKAGNL